MPTYPNPNLVSPSALSSGVLIADVISTTGGSNDSVARMTKVNGVVVSSALEIQSTTGGLTLPRMTSAQKLAIVTPIAGMEVFDTDLQTNVIYINGAWQVIAGLNGQQIATVTLNQAAVQGMYAAPQTIVAAPPAGSSLYVNSCVLINNFNTAAFAGGGNVILQYGTTNHGGGTNALSTIFNATVVTAGATSWASLVAPNAGTAITGTAATGLYLSNAGAAFTGGNAASTLVCIVQYQVIPANA